MCSHPDALAITVYERVVAIAGPILSGEREVVIVAAGAVADVISVRDRLTVPPDPRTVPELQGRGTGDRRSRWAAAAIRIALLLLGLGLFWSASRVARRGQGD